MGRGAADWQLSKVRIYVPGPEGTIGTMEFAPLAPFDKAETALVYHYDHLGSIDSITPYGSTNTAYALDGAGKPSRFNEDAWGQRRNPFTWSGAPATTGPNASDDGGSDSASPRGFTGHEMLDDLGLVHMNGRIYDPLLGRFLSADTFVQDAGDLQAYNRYSYVRNNPSSLNDPSGHFWSAVITAGFAAYDTYQYATGKISGGEYAKNMALNGAALVADVATLGNGGGLAVRAANIAIRTAKVIDKANDVYETAQGVVAAVEATSELASKVVEGNATLADVGNAALAVGGSALDAAGGGKGPDLPSGNMHVSRLDAGDVNTKKLDTVDTKTAPTTEVASTQRLPQDANVNPAAPAALPTDRPIGSSPTQNAAAQAEVRRMEDAGYTDIRVNQQQVNADGVRVGTNRPDVQGTSPEGKREYVEFDTEKSKRGPEHEKRIRANDPNGSVDLRTVN